MELVLSVKQWAKEAQVSLTRRVRKGSRGQIVRQGESGIFFSLSTSRFPLPVSWIKVRSEVHGARDGHLSSYSFTLLALFYLQVEHGLPSLQAGVRPTSASGNLPSRGQDTYSVTWADSGLCELALARGTAEEVRQPRPSSSRVQHRF